MAYTTLTFKRYSNMCGIVGLINHKSNGLSATDQEIFKRLLYIDVERGPDSTGLFSVNNDGSVSLLKEASPSYRFLENSTVDDVFKQAYLNGAFLVGHNRKATQGSISDENAHPFSSGDIVLVHNGSLHNHKSIEQVDVDSHAIAMTLDKHENDVKTSFEKFNGAYACVWYDNKTRSLNFFRNKERPLWFYKTPATTFFASESSMLFYAITRAGIKWESNNLVQLGVYQHRQFTLQPNGGGGIKSEDTELSIKEDYSNFQSGKDGSQTNTNVNGTINQTHGVNNISLKKRKAFRNMFQTYLNKKQIGSQVVFTPDNYDLVEGAPEMFILTGKVEGTPDFVQAVCMLHGVDEQSVFSMMEVPLDSKSVSRNIDHKNMVYQLNVQIDPLIVNVFKNETTSH